jgi:hypothetical protein
MLRMDEIDQSGNSEALAGETAFQRPVFHQRTSIHCLALMAALDC